VAVRWSCVAYAAGSQTTTRGSLAASMLALEIASSDSYTMCLRSVGALPLPLISLLSYRLSTIVICQKAVWLRMKTTYSSMFKRY